MKNAYRILWPTFCAVLLAACGGKQPAPASTTAKPPLASMVVRADEGPSQQIWDGTVQAVNSAVLTAQTDARVLALPYDVNDVVPAGAVLVRFTNVEQKSAARAAQAQIASAKADYVNAQANYQRLAAIYPQGYVSKAAYDQALAQRNAAKASLDAAQAQWREAGQAEKYTEVRAPYAGVITKRYVQVGEAVTGPPFAQQLIGLASLKDLRVDVKAPQSVADSIRRYGSAEIVLDGGKKTLAASKVTVFPYADPATHTFSVRLDLAGDHPGLYPGMTVKVAFATGDARRLLVPLSALVQRGELQGVYVIDGDHVSLRQVRTGDVSGDSIQVLAGLEGGEHIATDPDAAVRWLIEQRRKEAR
ncbi:efflux RND transporter periplasmic adaptor subunit [Dyella sp. A6]|uniref:efflux RND transporter periplasmic adaptor subunit n=1 Tax=Dyella aluminiiresistens TaxID=3069105 RepID=UPI002E773A13|nr:efflux RND transporter periplasmic adaptor subunit [Dyella sp. A6]